MSHVLYGMRRRVEDATLVHEHSSRSHLIVTLSITAVPRPTAAVPLSTSTSRVVLPDVQLTPPSSPSRIIARHRRSIPHKASSSPLVSPPASCNSSFSDFSAIGSGVVGSVGEGSVFKTKLQLVDLAGSECVGELDHD